jgi:hypothetical protein
LTVSATRVFRSLTSVFPKSPTPLVTAIHYGTPVPEG